MQFKSFMEALKGDQHKLDKNKNGKLDAHDFKLLRKEEDDDEDTPKSNKQIEFKNGEQEPAPQREERSMTDAEMKKREEYVKGMKKNISGFKDKYGDRAKDVMYATATKMAMKEETLEESVFDSKEQATSVASKLKTKHADGNYSVVADKNKHRVVHAYDSDSKVKKDIARLKEELDEAMINGREYASHGLMHPDHAAHAVHKVTGQSVDFYAHGTGDKVEGTVIKNDGKAVHIKDTKGKTHKFKVQRGLPKQQNEQAPVAPGLMKHRISVTVSEPDHPMVSKRKEKVQKTVIVTHSDNKEGARRVGEKFYAKKGYRVHDSNHSGMVNEEVELSESHFKVGDKVKCKASGMKGEVVKLDKDHGADDEKYYTVKRDDGEMKKMAPEDMTKLDENHLMDYRRYTQAAKNAKSKGDHDIAKDAEQKASKAAANYTRVTGKKPTFNEETDTSEKNEMAETQLHFIQYAAEEITGFIKMGGKIEEWYQNKLSKVHSDMESLHSYMEGESRRTGMKEEVEQDLAEAFANPGSGSTGTSRGAKRIANTVRKALAKNAETPEQRAARKEFEARFDAERRSRQGVKEEVDLNEDAYAKSEENKRSADSAKKQGNMFDYHMHMADHHDNLAQHHSEKGRSNVADQHSAKSEQHHEKAMSLKEETNQFDEEGNLMSEKLKFSDFIAKINEQLLEYESDDSGVYRHTKKATYGTSYQGDDDEDDKPKKPAVDAPKRGRGRPAGSTGASYKPRSAETKAAAAAKAAATKAANKK
jgi:hypothetical protein